MPRKRNAVETPAVWRLRLLGPAGLDRGQRTSVLDRFSAAILGYLALEGPTPRSLLADLLWPDRTEDAARANLRQRLKRLRDTVGADLISAEEVLRLRPDLEVDVVRLESLAFTGEYTEALAFEGEFLIGHDYTNCQELQAWVETTRERLRSARFESLAGESARLEGEGDLTQAVTLTERLLELDTYREDAYRRLMRLRYLLGDRSGALRAFVRCQDVLEQELGVSPMPETVELAALIERGAVPDHNATILPRPSIPLTVLRPPILAGRAREWAQLEAAWEAGQFIIVSGEPGVGKTRLVLDFVASKVPPESILYLQSRPGDTNVMYSSFARNWGRMLEQFKPQLEPWVRTELSRVLPELAETPDQPPEPIRSESEKLRFYQAEFESMLACVRAGLRVFISDDIQFADPASGEAALFLMGALVSASEQVGAVFVYRTDELSPDISAVIEQGLNAGLAVQVNLEPLGTEGVGALIEGLGLPNVDAQVLGAQLARYAGGNPMFALETIKHLIETRSLENGLPERLPPPASIKPLVQRRLERLSTRALRLARVAAVAGTDFDLTLASHVLETDVFELADQVTELEAAQVMTGNAFTHDLILEATLEGVPRTVQTLLHRRVAAYLETIQAQPARIAQHWLEGGDDAKAAPFLFEAAKRARAAFLYTDAIRQFRQAAALAQHHDLQELAFRSSVQVTEILSWVDQGREYAEAAQDLVARARTPEQKIDAYNAYSNVLVQQGKAAEAEHAARQGIRYTDEVGNIASKSALMIQLGITLFMQERFVEAVEVYRASIELKEKTGYDLYLGSTLANIAQSLIALERHREAIEYCHRALDVFKHQNQQGSNPQSLQLLAASQRSLGLVRTGTASLLEAQAILDGLQDADAQEGFNLMSLGTFHGELCDFRSALERLREAEALWNRLGSNYGLHVHRHLAPILIALGAYEQAESHLERFLGGMIHQQSLHGMGLLYLGRLRHLQQLPSQDILNESRKLLEPGGRPFLLGSWNLQQASILEPGEAVPLIEQTLASVRKYELNGLVIAAETRLAQILLQLGRAGEAREHSGEAVRLLETHDPVDFYLGEVLWTHHQTLEANEDGGAKNWLEQTLVWLLDIADNKVPSEFREGFLNHNPVNCAILEAARSAKLEGAQ